VPTSLSFLFGRSFRLAFLLGFETLKNLPREGQDKRLGPVSRPGQCLSRLGTSRGDDCHSQYGDDPDEADTLSECLSNAKSDYDSCIDDCEI
jgi:hypothetical protein